MDAIAPLRVMIVDDHRYIHETITNILAKVGDITIVGQAANGQEAIYVCEQCRPDIVLMDVVMPIMNGLEATKAIHGQSPDIRILVLSSFHDHDSVRALLTSGAVGYVTKSSLNEDLLHVVRTVAQGKTVLAPEIMQDLMNLPSDRAVYKFDLTDRELEVLVLLADGLTNQQTSEKLSISVSTLKFHMNNIFQKLGVQTRSEALVVAAKNNLI